MTTKTKIPASLRHNVWLKCNGKNFEAKCHVGWCKNIVTAFSFECGHNVPESKGGETSIENLVPICSACNKSMGNRFTIDEFSKAFGNNKIYPEGAKDNKAKAKWLCFCS